MRLARLADGRLARQDGERFQPLDFEGDVADLIRAGIAPGDLGIAEYMASEGSLQAPVRPGKIVAIGLNYLDHCREANMDPPERPLVFTKWTSSIVGPSDDIVVDRELTDAVDWEVELGVVIGQRMKDVPATKALNYVFGYTVANDVSARDVQTADGQWVRAKSMDTFCPLGPVVVTADEVPDPQALRIWTKVNGETMQEADTSLMVFGVAELLSFCSRNFPLEPGDLVITGTPWGVGFVRQPPIGLRDGDLVEAGVDGIGVLANRVRDAA
ncbi:MAG TPA: fumarylacetoacetate hydrolase family protein [Baekduia sp.]|nr:fumarylacetoacetate hydrolase family protein [Baekduia sp.]